MMEALARRLGAIGETRVALAREALAARLAEEVPPDIEVAVEEAGVVLSGRRLGMRWLKSSLSLLGEGDRLPKANGGGAISMLEKPLHHALHGPPPHAAHREDLV